MVDATSASVASRSGASRGRSGASTAAGGPREGARPSAAPGLVPSAITPRADLAALDPLALIEDSRRFPSADLVGIAAGQLRSAVAAGARESGLGAKHWRSGEAISWRVTVSPGSIRVGTTAVGSARQDAPDTAVEQAARIWQDWGQREAEELPAEGPVLPVRLGYPVDEETGELVEEDRPSRSEITEWSAKSRARMVERMAQLDYAPLFTEGLPTAMVTLTLPGDWLTVAPTGREFKKIVERFKTRYQRFWGSKIVGAWKLEFQGRGAPHLHILMTPPRDRVVRTKVDGVLTERRERASFHRWLSEAWAACCAHPDPEEYARHLRAGTGVDFGEGLRMTDPKRIAVYFSKHSKAGGGKEYQHRVPVEWQEPGAGPGRFWGYWGLAPATATVEVTPSDAITTARILRRWSRAQGLTRKVRRWRPEHEAGQNSPVLVDPETGAMRGQWRSTTIRAYRLQGGRGFITLNDAPAMLATISRYLDSHAHHGNGPGVQPRVRHPLAVVATTHANPAGAPAAPVRCSCCGEPLAAELRERGRHLLCSPDPQAEPQSL